MFRLVVGLLRPLFHAVPRVFGRVFRLVPRVLHILLCAAVLALEGRLTPHKSRYPYQNGSQKKR